jgi:hypothetical protein
MRTRIAAIVLILTFATCFCRAQQTNKTPILRGQLQSDLDGNGHTITNLNPPLSGGIAITNGFGIGTSLTNSILKAPNIFGNGTMTNAAFTVEGNGNVFGLYGDFAISDNIGSAFTLVTAAGGGVEWDDNVPSDSSTFAHIGDIPATNLFDLATTAAAKLALAPLKANNGSDFASALLTSSNVATVGLSNQTTLLPNGAQPVLPAAGAFPGQILITEGGGGGGGGIHQLFTWNSQGGSSNWDGGLEIRGPLEAYTTQSLNAGAGAGHWLAVSNSNNTLEIGQLNTNAYSAIGFTDQNNLEQFAFGFGESNAAGGSYRGMIYLGDNTQAPFFLTDASGHPKWGSPGIATPSSPAGTFGTFVVLTNTATNYNATNVMFSIDQSGNVNASGNVSITNGLTTAAASTTTLNGNASLLGTTFVGGSSGTANTGGISGGVVTANTHQGLAVGPTVVVGPSGTGLANAESFGCDLQIGARGQTNIWIHGTGCNGFDPWNGNPGVEIMQSFQMDGPVTNAYFNTNVIINAGGQANSPGYTNNTVTTTLASGFSNGGSITTLSVTSATGIQIGQFVIGAGIPSGIRVSSVSGTTIGAVFTASANSSGTYTFGSGGFSMSLNIIGASGSIIYYQNIGTGGATVCGFPVWTNTVSSTGSDYIIPMNCGVAVTSGVGVHMQSHPLN